MFDMCSNFCHTSILRKNSVNVAFPISEKKMNVWKVEGQVINKKYLKKEIYLEKSQDNTVCQLFWALELIFII